MTDEKFQLTSPLRNLSNTPDIRKATPLVAMWAIWNFGFV